MEKKMKSYKIGDKNWCVCAALAVALFTVGTDAGAPVQKAQQPSYTASLMSIHNAIHKAGYQRYLTYTSLKSQPVMAAYMKGIVYRHSQDLEGGVSAHTAIGMYAHKSCGKGSVHITRHVFACVCENKSDSKASIHTQSRTNIRA